MWTIGFVEPCSPMNQMRLNRTPTRIFTLTFCLDISLIAGHAIAVDRAEVQETKPPGKLLRKLDRENIKSRRWFRFSDTYFRWWGGAKTGSLPKGVSVSPSGEHVYVTNFGYRNKNNVYRYDPKDLSVQARANYEGLSIESVVSKDGNTVYVSNFKKRRVEALDALTLAVKRLYPVGRLPKHFALTPDEKYLLVSNWMDGKTSVVDTETGETIKRIPVGEHPRGTAVNHAGTKAYVANFRDWSVSLIDTKTWEVTKTIRSCNRPRHIAISKDDSKVFVSCYTSSLVQVIDGETDKQLRRIRVGRGPKTIELSKDERFAYTADYKNNSLSIIDTNTWKVKVVPAPLWKASGLAVSPDDRRIYLTGFDSVNLVVFERFFPGDAISEPGPDGPSGECRRFNSEACFKFP